KPGTHYIPATLVDLTNGEAKRTSPVVGARMVGGLVPCNLIADEILTDHPRRYRAMLVEAANPAHSIADSKRFREALSALDTLVMIDVAMSETAKLAHYVLPACSQFEKAEATFFNFDFPENYFHLRRRLLSPMRGTLPEAEIHARLCEALGSFTEGDLAPLRAAAARGLEAYAGVFLEHVMPNPQLAGLAPVLLYRTLELPEEVREGAVLFGLAARAAMQFRPALERAGLSGSPVQVAGALFERILGAPSGVVFAVEEWADTLGRLKRPIQLALPDLLNELDRLNDDPPEDPAFPFVLSAGERRSFTANTIIRDPDWRKKDAEGALRINPDDAASLGVSTGECVRLVTRRAEVTVPIEVSATMQRSHIALPNGLGVAYGEDRATGIAPNELTAAGDRDPFVGTPWHKHVPARLERV